MRPIASALRALARVLRTAGSDLGRELARLNNVADARASSGGRARKVKEWIKRRNENSARCC